MEVTKSWEKEHELECGGGDVCNDGDNRDNDNCKRRITTAQASSVENDIEHLELVQELSTKLANYHSTQREGIKNNNDDDDDDIETNNVAEKLVESRVDRDSLEREVGSTKCAQNHSALAFTIDFGDNKNIVESPRYQNLFQRYARHKRNLSTSKIEIKEKTEVADLSPNFVKKYKPLSIHSEGYFSSEDDSKRKVDRLSQKLKELGLKTKGAMKKSDTMSKPGNSMHDNKKRRSYHEESTNNCTTETTNQITYSSTLNDLSKIQNNIEEDRNRVQYSPEKKYIKNIEYIEINHDDYIDEGRLEKSSLDATEKLSNTTYLSEKCSSLDGFASSSSKNMNVNQTMSVSYTDESINCTDMNKTNLDVFNVSAIDAGSDGTVSEAGTYTIHKDYTDEEKARMDIDKVFSVGILTEEESNELYVHHFKMQSSRDTNTWISEWATQVAEHNSLPSTIGSNDVMGRTPPLSPSKIPSPVYSRTPLRGTRNRYEQSDSSLDTDIQQMREKFCITSNQHGLIDSGGESDEDTSNSYHTPPHSSQRTPTHSGLVRRGSLSESLFKRVNNNDCRRSMRKYSDIKKKDDITIDVPKSPSHVLARLHLERGSSLDRKSDTAESNSSRRSSLKNYPDDNHKHTNSPILNRLRPTTPKLTNSPIFNHKNINIQQTRIVNSPSFERPRQLVKSNSQTKNIGYYTCVESSPYMLRKSNSTSNYREDTSLGIKELSFINNSSMLNRNINIQRSTSNTSIRNMKTMNLLSRRSSFNDHNGIERMSKGKIIVSDSSSEAGEIPCSIPPPISSGIKLNRTFSMRRARAGYGDSDTTPNTTPEERRRKGQVETKSAPSSARQSNHYRPRTNSVGGNNKDSTKKSETPRPPRIPSLSRNESGRYSMRSQKTSSSNNIQSTRPNSKTNNNRDIKNSGRSNSTLTSKEVEFQNWKRRKNYDPMKAAAEGKKKLDNSRKIHSIEDNCNSRDNSVLRSASFHGTRGTLSLADNDWSENEQQNFIEHREIIQIPPPCSPLGSDSDLDTSSYLQTTQNVMSAMSARITVYQTPAVDSGGESDEDTSHSLRQINKTHGSSDTESSDDTQAPPPMKSSTGPKFMRSFGLRRGRDNQEVKLPPRNKFSSANSRQKSETITSSIARTDSGRFSMRSTKGSSSTNASSKAKPKESKKQCGISSREQEMQNWKRRKSYDPMKAAMEGKKKAEMIKKNLNSESSSVLRSQSFHGHVNLGISEWSDEDVSASADEAPIY